MTVFCTVGDDGIMKLQTQDLDVTWPCLMDEVDSWPCFRYYRHLYLNMAVSSSGHLLRICPVTHC